MEKIISLFFLSLTHIQCIVRLVKTVRMQVSYVEDLLMEPSLDLTMILLVRDPRGVMKSRNKLEWCSQRPETCASVSNMCNDLNDNIQTALRLVQMVPNQIFLLRYVSKYR